MTTILEPLYNPITNKYLIDLGIAGITILLNAISDDLEGWEYIYKASHIKVGAVNWTLFAVYLTFFVPHFFGEQDKLTIFSYILVVFWLMVLGCWLVVGTGQSWKSHGTTSRVALIGSPFLLAVLSFAIFIFFDYFFWLI